MVVEANDSATRPVRPTTTTGEENGRRVDDEDDERWIVRRPRVWGRKTDDGIIMVRCGGDDDCVDLVVEVAMIIDDWGNADA